MYKLFAVIYMHQFLVLCVACDTVQTAGMTEGAELGNKTNCLHFLGERPLQGTPMNITQLKNNDSHEGQWSEGGETER